MTREIDDAKLAFYIKYTGLLPRKGEFNWTY